MRVMVAHNMYQQPGGEDSVANAEVELLRSRGEDVYFYERSNAEFAAWPAWKQLRHWLTLAHSEESYRHIRAFIQQVRPDVVHSHNTFYMMTPALYRACADESVPVVQSLHNFRLACANGLFLREGTPCELCVTDQGASAIRYKCYRDSKFLTWGVVRMNRTLKRGGIWDHGIQRFIAASQFAKAKFVESGIAAEKIAVKPNFIAALSSPPDGKKRSGALYVGRLSVEKGVDVLIKAWRKVADVPLTIVGSGPLADTLRNETRDCPHICFRGNCSQADVLNLMVESKLLVLPSICYENFPRTLAEAYACGLPVLGSDSGSLRELIVDGETGYAFRSGSAEDLERKARHMLDNEDLSAALSAGARRYSEQHLSPEMNYDMLRSIYREAIEAKR